MPLYHVFPYVLFQEVAQVVGVMHVLFSLLVMMATLLVMVARFVMMMTAFLVAVLPVMAVLIPVVVAAVAGMDLIIVVAAPVSADVHHLALLLH